MINISHHRDLDKICNEYYYTFKDDMLKIIKENKSFLNKYRTKSKEKLGVYLKDNLNDLITLPLDELVLKFTPILEDVFNKNYTNKNIKFKKVINSIFFFENHSKWGAYKLTQVLNINACPYCNRTYITTLGSENKKFSRPDIDHFLAKSKYPYLRMSFYNLIPSCVICNRNAKGKKETSLEKNIYPFTNGFENIGTENYVRFNYRPKNYMDAIGKGEPLIEFSFNGDEKHIKKCKNNIDLFRLEEQYSMQFNELNHLMQLKQYYSVAYLEDLTRKYPHLLQDYKEAYKLAFGKEYELTKDDNLPLSKFTRDILKELKMLEKLKNE